MSLVLVGALTLALAVADWVMVARGDVGARRITKLLPMLVLLAGVVLTTTGEWPAAAWLVAGIVAGLAGDAFLLEPLRPESAEVRFMAGLGSFALGHLAYVVTALVAGVDRGWAVLAVPFLVVLLGYRFASETVPGARRHGGIVLSGLVVLYAAIISAMVVTATGTAYVAAAVGSMLFAISDWLLGYQRFVRPLGRGRHGEVAVMVTYHVGQTLLVLALAAALRAR